MCPVFGSGIKASPFSFQKTGFSSLKIYWQVRRSAVIGCAIDADRFALAAIASSVFSPRYLGLTHSSKRGVKVPPRFAGIYIGHNVIPSEDVFVDHNAQFEREVRRVIFVCLL